jgi:hypothetical protein
MKEHKVIELVSMETAAKVARKDFPLVSTEERYISENTLSYYLIINTWVLLVKQFSPHVYARLLDRILHKGLIPVIAEMQDEATRVVNQEELGPWATLMYRDVRLGNPMVDKTLSDSLIGDDDTATVLFLLRYPKRFSPSMNDIVKEKTLKDFVAYENRTKLLQRSRTFAYTWLVPYVRDEISRMYDWDLICAAIDKIKADPARYYALSSGSATDASPTLGAKISTLCADGNLEYVQPIQGVYTLMRYPVHRESLHVSKIVAVPKSYKASRIIAMEPVRFNAFGKAVESVFRNADKQYRNINLENQGINQELACVGSLNNDLATLDASHASDLISKSLFVDVFPASYVSRVLWCLPDYCEVEGSIRPLQMASTSGHTLTFRHETIVYLAIARASVRIYEGLTGEEVTGQCWAYGDDVIIPSAAYDVALHLYKRLGLIINDDKSFHDGPFRESCGKDYMDGMDVSSVYYPRFPVIGTVKKDKITLSSKTYNDEYRGKLENSLTMLIDLQKKLFPYCYDASRLVLSIVKTAYPSVTTSIAGSVCNDLWDYVDSGKPSIPVMYGIEWLGERILPRSRYYRWAKLGPATDSLSGSNRALFERAAALDTKHTYPAVRYNSKKDFSPTEEAVYEYWKYINFLQFGPRFDSPLDELLGVTTRQMSISEFYGKATLALVTK